MYTLIEIFIMLFVTMGPIKVLIVFAEKAGDLDAAARRRVAIKAVLVAALIGLLFVFAGLFLVKLFKFSLPAMMIAGGLILLIFSIRMVLSENSQGSDHAADPEDGDSIAIYPLAVPLMASPMGIVAILVLSASTTVSDLELVVLAILLLAVMAINLAALLLEARFVSYIPSQALQVAERILGILLAALAVETIIHGLNELGVLAVNAVP